MYRRLMLIAVAGALIGTASARTFEAVEGAYEAVLADVVLPGSVAGTLIIRMCATCDAMSLPVSAATGYVGPNGQSLELADFLESAVELRRVPGGEQTTGVGVFYNLETKRVTRVSLHPGAFE
jgi:hypothetical protein